MTTSWTHIILVFIFIAKISLNRNPITLTICNQNVFYHCTIFIVVCIEKLSFIAFLHLFLNSYVYTGVCNQDILWLKENTFKFQDIHVFKLPNTC